jgi:hypothetical protein
MKGEDFSSFLLPILTFALSLLSQEQVYVIFTLQPFSFQELLLILLVF